jgi:uronate dehydrogenase
MSKILLTGASGSLGTHLRNWFKAHGREYLATDIAASKDGEDIVLADLVDSDALEALVGQDISAIVHFGGMAKENKWQTILDANIIGTYNVFEAARRARVKRIVYASTYHVQGMYPTADVPIALDAPYRPDSLYAVSKMFGEGLSRLYFDKFEIECLAIRICTAGFPGTNREARLWFNRDDMARMVDHALDMPVLGHRTVFGISNTENAFFYNTPDDRWGFEPQHNGTELAPLDVHAHLDPSEPRHILLGGAFATWGHQDDEAN